MSKTIDLTPTWSAIGAMYIRFAESNEQAVITKMAPEIRKAFALATAATAIYPALNESQKETFDLLWQGELKNRN